MSNPPNEFERLMERVRAGDPNVGQEIFERYGKAIRTVVHFHLDRRLRSQFDSLDFTQDVWASFFRLPAENYTFRTPEELMAFLTRVARHKVMDAYKERCRNTKKNGRKFVRIHSYGEEQPARQPTPSHTASLSEEWGRLLQDTPPKFHRALEMLRDGYSQREIAQHLGIYVKEIQRLLKKLNGITRSS